MLHGSAHHILVSTYSSDDEFPLAASRNCTRTAKQTHTLINTKIYTRPRCLWVFLPLLSAAVTTSQRLWWVSFRLPGWNAFCTLEVAFTSAARWPFSAQQGKVVQLLLIFRRIRGLSRQEETTRAHVEVIRKYYIQCGTSRMFRNLFFVVFFCWRAKMNFQPHIVHRPTCDKVKLFTRLVDRNDFILTFTFYPNWSCCFC